MPPSEICVFFDFDNTISTFDVLDDIVRRFSGNDSWMQLEKDWQAGRVGTRECLDRHVRGLRVGSAELKRYLKRVPLDPYFRKILILLEKHRVPFAILSDNLDFILKEILRAHGMENVPFFCNKVRVKGRRWFPSFPLTDPDCPGCAHCKKQHLPQDGITKVIYAGDGFSDFCPAQRADIVFAKATLLKLMRRAKLPCRPFKTLKPVYLFLKKFLAENSKTFKRPAAKNPASRR